ncbi:MAG: YaiO family outer membrane beta-barrel protein [Allomuricauda sp.]|nr:MAG: YaiO family outer membrane beta-barrel protein [Allomuricauda sp.]
MKIKSLYIVITVLCTSLLSWSQDSSSYQEAYQLAFQGKHAMAVTLLEKELVASPHDMESRLLLASSYSWEGRYKKAREEFNKITSQDKMNKQAWTLAIKNELYAKADAIALGLANKALISLKNDDEMLRLRELALQRINTKKYPNQGWHNQDDGVADKKTRRKQKKEAKKEVSNTEKQESKNESSKNRIGINNSFTVFTDRYDPMVYSSIRWRHETKVGNIIPKINYSNRLGQHGIQYDIDFYPRFLKRFYAYLNYGYSNAQIYPRHKFGGDIYANLPGAIEVSAGGRYIVTQTQDVKAITGSLGHYRGNYYFSLRSFITPRPDGLTRVSGNLLVRKYTKDAENFMGVNVGMGISPELQQIVAGNQLLAETLLFIESQRLRFEYQFTGKKTPNIYRANIGAVRQELVSESGQFFWGISAGLTYEVKF